MAKARYEQSPCCQRWATREGKRHLYETSMWCNFIALATLFIAFCTPYWVESWPRVHSPFKRLGLWEVCFGGFVLEWDPNQKSYHGCWWILSSEFKDIKDWLFPSYFVYTQVIITIALVAEIVLCVLAFYIWFSTGGFQMDDKPPKRENLTLVQISYGITAATGLVMIITTFTFGLMVYEDRNWLPLPHFNYLSWSYGLTIVSTFFTVFAFIALTVFVVVLRHEHREPPKAVSMAGYLPPEKVSGF